MGTSHKEFACQVLDDMKFDQLLVVDTISSDLKIKDFAQVLQPMIIENTGVRDEAMTIIWTMLSLLDVCSECLRRNST